MSRLLGKLRRATLAAVLLGSAGCCHWCDCCCGPPAPPARRPVIEGPPTNLPPADGVVPPVGPRPGIGAYGGTGP